MGNNMQTLEAEANKIADWLNTHQEHTRFDEGFEKLREIYNKMAVLYNEINKPKQEVLF